MQVVENVTIISAKGERKVKYLDIISNNASFANALSNVEPHQHFSGHQSIPESILYCCLTETSCLDTLDEVCGPLDGLGDLGRGRGDKFNTGIVPEGC